MPRNIFFVFLAFGIAIAGGSAYFYVSSWLEVAQGRGWPTTQGIVRSADVEERTSRDSNDHVSYTYYPRIAYTYRVGSRTLNGERIWLSGNDFYNRHADAVAFVQDYEVGAPVPVLYDPRHPGQSALLNPSPPWQILLFTVGGLVWIALSVGARLSWRRPPRPRFGSCKQCGARLPFDQHSAVRGAVPAVAAGVNPTPDVLPCPRCGQREPLSSWRNRRPQILFAIIFVGIWAIGLYLMFFAM